MSGTKKMVDQIPTMTKLETSGLVIGEIGRLKRKVRLLERDLALLRHVHKGTVLNLRRAVLRACRNKRALDVAIWKLSKEYAII